VDRIGPTGTELQRAQPEQGYGHLAGEVGEQSPSALAARSLYSGMDKGPAGSGGSRNREEGERRMGRNAGGAGDGGRREAVTTTEQGEVGRMN
jgi:hypothetical protein